MDDDNLENAILFGPVGSGKTTVLNLLANTNYTTAKTGYSCTRQIQGDLCSYCPFRIIDFPGTDAAVDQVQHVQVQQTALKSHHFKVIIIVYKLTERLDDIPTKLAKVIRLFRHHLDNIVVVITHCDNFGTKEQAEAQYVMEHTLHLPHSFCKTSTTDGGALARWIYSFVKGPEMTRVEAGNGIFESYNLKALIGDNVIDNEVIELREKSEKNFKQIYDSTLVLFREEGTDKELKRALYFSLKQHMDEIADNHAKEVAPLLPDKWKLNAEIIIFQNSLMSYFSTFKTMVTREIEVENTIYGGSSHQYRECPKCGTVWFRIYGCDGIICGRRSISRDFSNHKFYNFSIRWILGRLQWEKIESPPNQTRFTDKELVGLSSNEEELNQARAKVGKQLIKPVGCGAKLDWSDMKDVTSRVLNELKEFDFDLTSETDNIVEKHEQKVTKIVGDSSVPVAPSKGQEKQPVKTISPVQDYSVEQVADWLKTINLEKYIDKFKAEEVNGETLLGLDDQTLKSDLGLTLGAVKALRKALNN